MIKLKLFIVALFGTLVGFMITAYFIQEMTFWQFFLIEVLVTFSHQLYTYYKQTLIEQNPT